MDDVRKPFKRLSPKSPEIRRKERLNSELLVAVFNEDLPALESLLVDEAKKILPTVNARCVESNATALHIATLKGDVEIATLLLEKGAEVNVRDKLGRLPLHYAAWDGDIEMFKLIFERDASLINSPVIKLDDPLDSHDVCSWQHNHNDFKFLVDTVQCAELSTALHIAALRSQHSIVDFLVENNADTNLKDCEGKSPLDVAGLKNKNQRTEHLIDASSIHAPKLPEFPDSFTDDYSCQPQMRALPVGGSLLKVVNKLLKGDVNSSQTKLMNSTMLHNAMLNQDLDVIDVLLNNSDNLEVLDDAGDSPLQFAIRERNLEALKLILGKLPQSDIDKTNTEGLTALHLAVTEQWYEGVGLLLENGANVRIATRRSGETVYHIAAKLGNSQLLEELLSEPCAEVVEQSDFEGLTPIHKAIESGSLPVVELLVEVANVRLDILLPDGRNLIHFSVMSAKITEEMFKYLVSLKDCKGLIDSISPPHPKIILSGLSPLQISATEGKENLVTILLNAGADPLIKSAEEPNGSTTALHLAAEKGYTRTIIAIIDNNPISLDIQDGKQYKPVHVACQHGHGHSIITMVKKGANLMDPIQFEGQTKTALELMINFVPRCDEMLNKLFTAFIKNQARNNYRLLNDPESSVELNFELFLKVGYSNGKRFTFLQVLAESDMRENLLNPLVEIYTRIKWHRCWSIFVFIFALHFVHTLSLTVYCILAFMTDSSFVIYVQILFAASYFNIFMTEVRQMSNLQNWYGLESWIKNVMLVTNAIVIVGSLYENQWLIYIASFAILTSWAELLSLLSWVGYSGLDVLMFEKVSQNVLSIFSKFTFLFLGFTFALMIHFKGAPPFENFFKSFTQVISMIVELNYSDTFDKNSQVDLESTIGRLIYICFIIFVGITLINLTIGISVSDISSLKNEGRVVRLIKRISFVNFLETVFDEDWIFGCWGFGLLKCVSFMCRKNGIGTVERIHIVFPNKPNCPVYAISKVGVGDIVGRNKPLYFSSRIKNSLISTINTPPNNRNLLSTTYFDARFVELTNHLEQMKMEINNIKDDHHSSSSSSSSSSSPSKS